MKAIEIDSQGDMRTLKNELVDKGLSQACIQENDDTKNHKLPKEMLSQRDLMELMSVIVLHKNM